MITKCNNYNKIFHKISRSFTVMLKYLKSLFYLFVFYFFFNFSSNLLATEIKEQEDTINKDVGVNTDD